MVRLSVVIITLNEEKNIGRCLQSVMPVADEIIVVDSLSQDKTVEICKSYGAKVFNQPFEGFIKQKIIATNYASNNWIFTLDADEVLTPELQQSILEVKKDPRFNAYSISRFTNYCGKWIRHCGWHPDYIVRMFDRTKGNWQGDLIHEHWEFTNAHENAGILRGHMLHYSYDTIASHVRQIDKFTELTARAAINAGKNYSMLEVWLGPKWTFFSMYILRLGFLDGYHGYLICKFSAYATFVKYSKVRQYRKQGISESKNNGNGV